MRVSAASRAREIKHLVREHQGYRGRCLNLLAAENVTSPTVREMVASDLMHRYAEYEQHDIAKRWDEGTKYVVEIEKLGEELAKELFRCRYVDLRPISGHLAAAACILAHTRKNGATLEVRGADGGHEWHNLATRIPAMRYTPGWLPFDSERWNLDVDACRKKISAERPDVVILGSSFYLFPHPVREVREAAEEVGTKVVYDGAHVLGLIAGKCWPDPLKNGAHLMAGSTHKSFPGPQKGIILSDAREDFEKVRDVVYPALSTNHHLMNVAALAYATAEFIEHGEDYARQVVGNARALAAALSEQGLDVVGEASGFTSSHQVLVRTRPRMEGSSAARALDAAKIVCNKMELGATNGIRIGVSEVTRLGMEEEEMKEVAGLIGEVVVRKKNPSGVARKVEALAAAHRRLSYSFDEGSDPYEYFGFSG